MNKDSKRKIESSLETGRGDKRDREYSSINGENSFIY